MTFNNFVIVPVERIYYKIRFWCLTKSQAVIRMKWKQYNGKNKEENRERSKHYYQDNKERY